MVIRRLGDSKFNNRFNFKILLSLSESFAGYVDSDDARKETDRLPPPLDVLLDRLALVVSEELSTLGGFHVLVFLELIVGELGQTLEDFVFRLELGGLALHLDLKTSELLRLELLQVRFPIRRYRLDAPCSDVFQGRCYPPRLDLLDDVEVLGKRDVLIARIREYARQILRWVTHRGHELGHRFPRFECRLAGFLQCDL